MRKKKNYKKIRIVYIIIIIFCLIKLSSITSNVSVGINKSNNLSTNQEIIQENLSEVTENSIFPDKVFEVPVHTQLIEINTKARPGIKRKIKYIVIHETDNFSLGTGAKNHAEFLNKNNVSSTSWHYTVDDKEIYHHIPDNEIAYHAATDIGNLYGIGIELCVNKDGNFQKTFNNAAKLVAYLIKEYDLTIHDIKTHKDFSGKNCPASILKNNRMQEFLKEVEKLQ